MNGYAHRRLTQTRQLEIADTQMCCGSQYVGATMRAKVESGGQPGSVSIDKTQYDPSRNKSAKCPRLSLKN
jgi:hypothetical protein